MWMQMQMKSLFRNMAEKSRVAKKIENHSQAKCKQNIGGKEQNMMKHVIQVCMIRSPVTVNVNVGNCSPVVDVF